MSNLINHAKSELEMAGLFDEEKDFYGGQTGKAVMELIEVFAAQGHSGMSSGVVISLFKELAAFNPINPITGADEEWTEVGEDMYQNKRLSSVFKEGKDGNAYFLDAIIWKEKGGGGFSGTVNGITSRRYIKFPFLPKTFYVEVDDQRRIVDLQEFQKAIAHYPNI